MTDSSALHPPQAVTRELDISPATLRRWSTEFGDCLSPAVNSAQDANHRQYTHQDIQTLQKVKELLDSGLTYEQVRLKILSLPPQTVLVEDENFDDDEPFDLPRRQRPEAAETEPESGSALVAAGGESPAIAFLTNTLTTLSDTQQSILNSQAANRELMGVLIQDNFNLKEENNRLRERILDIERNLAQTRQEDEWRRESLRQELDAKIGAAQKMATNAVTLAQAVEVPDIKTIKGKPGCLGGLLGLSGDMQVVTVPHRRKPHPPEPGPAVMPAPVPPPPPPYSGPVAPVHPKPTAPPE